MIADNEDIDISPTPTWLDEHQAQNIRILKVLISLHYFFMLCFKKYITFQICLPDLYNNLGLTNESAWKATLSKINDEVKLHVNITLFQTVLVVQALKPDMLYTAINHCVLNILGKLLNI